MLRGIKFLTKKSDRPKNIHEKIVVEYWEHSPSYFKIIFWCKQFIHDDLNCEGVLGAWIEEINTEAEDLVSDDHQVKYQLLLQNLDYQKQVFSNSAQIFRNEQSEQKLCRQ